MKVFMCIAAAVVTTMPSCGTAPRRAQPVMTISNVLSDAQKLDGQIVTVEALIRNADVHGMFVTDLCDATKAMNLYIEPEIAWSEPVMEMTRMLLVDRDRARPLGVSGVLTGRFSWKAEALSLLAISKVEDLRWGAEPSQCR